MQRWRGVEEIPAGWGPSVVTIGVFDGVHRGHQYLVARAVAAARESGVAAAVITFDPHPMAVLRPDRAPATLASLDRRLDLLDGLGVDAVCVLPFTTELSGLSPEDFVEHVLAERLHVTRVVVGVNFRFGHKAAGDVPLLTELGERYGFTVDAVPLAGDEPRWSSTRVRAALDVGDVQAAADVLGRPHRVEGRVVVGDRRGRDLGYPTANLAVARDAAVPAHGVYAGWLVHDGRRLPAAISIGTNPTFSGTQTRVEAYVLDRDDLDLYGAEVGLDVTARLRDTVRFDSVEALLAQMAEDVRRTREVLVGQPG
ncbi:MAG: bifunctional riboflavin kinase/FAD synthetase [Actinomycetes bacterium]